jgi:hypothetical protein
MNEIIFEMFGRGFDVNMGPHGAGLAGFFAAFIPTDTFEWPMEWHEVAHGESLNDALIMARAMALGETVQIPAPEEFL